MKLWRVSYIAPEGAVWHWCASQGEAKKSAKQFLQEYKMTKDEVTTEPIEVPVTKVDLIKWLNDNAGLVVVE